MTVVDESVVRMANQIAANFSYLAAGEAAEATAHHIRRYWTPDMRQRLLNQLAGGGGRLSPAALEAARLL